MSKKIILKKNDLRFKKKSNLKKELDDIRKMASNVEESLFIEKVINNYLIERNKKMEVEFTQPYYYIKIDDKKLGMVNEQTGNYNILICADMVEMTLFKDVLKSHLKGYKEIEVCKCE